MEISPTDFLWSVASLGSVGVILVKELGRQSMYIEWGREAWYDMESSSDGMMWGDWGVGSEVIVDGRPEGMDIAVELLDLGYV